MRTGQVRVDGARATTATRLAPGQKIRVPPVKIAPPAPKAGRLGRGSRAPSATMILYEDEDLMVLNKPYGLAVQGGSGTRRHIDGMLASLANAQGERPVLVHRLDRDTAGVLLVAKSRRIAAKLGEIFRSRKAQKIYWALVEGVPKPAQGRISLFLAKGEGMEQERGSRRGTAERADLEKMRIAKHGDENAQHSVTYYAVVDKVRRPARLAFDEADHRAHASIARACRGDRSSDHRRSRNMAAASRIGARKIRRGKSPSASSASCIFWRGGSFCRIRAAARSMSPRRCRRI